MQPEISVVDPIARFISFAGFGIATVVAVIQILNYLRGRKQNPKIRVRLAGDSPIIIFKPGLVVASLFIDNQSTIHNTLISINCFVKRHWFQKTQLKIGDLQVSFAATENTAMRKYSMKLAIAPSVELGDNDWKQLFTQKGMFPEEGIWSMPLRVPELDSRLIYVAIAPECEEERLDDEMEITIVLRDVIDKCHDCSVNLKAAISDYKKRQILAALARKS